MGDDHVKDFIFEDEEFGGGGGEEGHSSVDPMMGETERIKGRQQELTERLLALSATIPGFKKVGKYNSFYYYSYYFI